MKIIIHRQPVVNEGLPGFVTVAANLVTREELDPQGNRMKWDDPNLSPKPVADILKGVPRATR